MCTGKSDALLRNVITLPVLARLNLVVELSVGAARDALGLDRSAQRVVRAICGCPIRQALARKYRGAGCALAAITGGYVVHIKYLSELLPRSKITGEPPPALLNDSAPTQSVAL